MKPPQRHKLAFIKVLKAYRLRKKLSQKALAEKLGVPQSFVSKYESGERRLDLLELRQICSALGISIGQVNKELSAEIKRQAP